MPSSSSVHPVKQNKAGKAVSWSLIGLLLAAALIGGVFQLVTDTGPTLATDSDVVSITQSGNKRIRQPISPKIESSDQPVAAPQTQLDQIDSYEKVWARIDALAEGFGDYSGDGVVSPQEKDKFVKNMLTTLNFQARQERSEITSVFNGKVISPETIYCYLNGYVPNKPYLKPNCPSY